MHSEKPKEKGRPRVSATGRGSEREKDDFYETPKWCVDLIRPYLPDSDTVIDLGCGTGAIGSVFLRDGHTVFGYELDEKRARVTSAFWERPSQLGHVVQMDILNDPQARELRFPGALVVMNPPYKLALDFVVTAHEMVGARGTVAALLRLNWLAGQARAPFHHRYPADIYVLPKRPSFFKNGKTDATEYAWFVWSPREDRRWGGRWFLL